MQVTGEGKDDDQKISATHSGDGNHGGRLRRQGRECSFTCSFYRDRGRGWQGVNQGGCHSGNMRG